MGYGLSFQQRRPAADSNLQSARPLFFRPGPTALNGGPASGFANAFASFLLDLPNEYGRDLPGTFPTVRQKTLFTYVQDKWNVTQKLTLNLGLRHEIYFAPTPMFPGGFSNYIPTNNTLELAGIGRIPDNMGRKTNYNNFAPRFGVAYRFSEKTVFRGGYGISIDASFPDDKYAFNFPVKQNNAFTAANASARLEEWQMVLRLRLWHPFLLMV